MYENILFAVLIHSNWNLILKLPSTRVFTHDATSHHLHFPFTTSSNLLFIKTSIKDSLFIHICNVFKTNEL